MRVFLSWSGELSKAVAVALAGWLPIIIPSAKPWMSEHDIQAGAVWEDELNDQVTTADCGVLILTKGNQNAPWLLFEAGVLSKSANRKLVIPYRVSITLAEVAAPLLRFQGVDADSAGTKRLVNGLNSVLPHPVPDEHLGILFDAFWPKLEAALTMARNGSVSMALPRRSAEDYFDEILGILRSSRSPQSPGLAQEPSAELATKVIASEIASLNAKITSMEEYEEKNGGASSEPWWDAYVQRHKRALSLYLDALSRVQAAQDISLTA